MKLEKLLRDVPVLECHEDLETDITSIAYDSRKVRPGGLFVAVSGLTADGNRFIPMALEKGARAVVTAVKPKEDIPYVLVENERLALAKMACNFYGRPAEAMHIIGVTGTNGKTSVTLLLKSLLERTLGVKVGLVGTMGNLIGDEPIPSERTTPESLELQELFARMRDAGCSYVIMEVSSHAIALDRIGGIHYEAAAFTNLTEDHLDFHKTMDDYCDAKAELFRRCSKAVVNVDDPYAPRMLAAAACRGLENDCTRNISDKSTFEIVFLKGIFSGLGSFLIALCIGEPFPGLHTAAAALLLGFVAYGLSIFCYVRSQNTLGAAKTSAYYAIAPFIGTALSCIIWHDALTVQYFLALAVMLLGSVLVVLDTLQTEHTHSHTHTFTHTHDGVTHTHTITHSHPHLHGMHGESHQHRHTMHTLLRSHNSLQHR